MHPMGSGSIALQSHSLDFKGQRGAGGSPDTSIIDALFFCMTESDYYSFQAHPVFYLKSHFSTEFVCFILM